MTILDGSTVERFLKIARDRSDEVECNFKRQISMKERAAVCDLKLCPNEMSIVASYCDGKRCIFQRILATVGGNEGK